MWEKWKRGWNKKKKNKTAKLMKREEKFSLS